MPWGWECREKLIKQGPFKSHKRQLPIAQEFRLPGPSNYTPPELFCGPGYSKIKKEPAYSFGLVLKPMLPKRSTKAKMFDISGMGPKGTYRIPGCVMSPQLTLPYDKGPKPGPGAYDPNRKIEYKRAPAYTMTPVARPPYQPWDQWTPPPNMYLPPKPGEKRYPAYTFGGMNQLKPYVPGPSPGRHDPNFNYVKKTKPAFAFGSPFRRLRLPQIPAPNAYCEKRYKVALPTPPAPSFGIRHSQYIGKRVVYEKPDNLTINIAGDN